MGTGRETCEASEVELDISEEWTRPRAPRADELVGPAKRLEAAVDGTIASTTPTEADITVDSLVIRITTRAVLVLRSGRVIASVARRAMTLRQLVGWIDGFSAPADA